MSNEENEKTLEVKQLSAHDILGATVMNNALLFIKMLPYPDRLYEIDVEGEGDMTYYVSGLSEGKWSAKVAGKSLRVLLYPRGGLWRGAGADR